MSLEAYAEMRARIKREATTCPIHALLDKRLDDFERAMIIERDRIAANIFENGTSLLED